MMLFIDEYDEISLKNHISRRLDDELNRNYVSQQ